MRIPCKRCLINTDAFVREHITRQLANIPQEQRVADEEYERRLLACDSCKHLMGATCAACGVFAEVRAASRDADCPLAIWGGRNGRPGTVAPTTQHEGVH